MSLVLTLNPFLWRRRGEACRRQFDRFPHQRRLSTKSIRITLCKQKVTSRLIANSWVTTPNSDLIPVLVRNVIFLRKRQPSPLEIRIRMREHSRSPTHFALAKLLAHISRQSHSSTPNSVICVNPYNSQYYADCRTLSSYEIDSCHTPATLAFSKSVTALPAQTYPLPNPLPQKHPLNCTVTR